jgi:hypothetical protein
MKIGVLAIKRKGYGMPEKHMEAIATVATKQKAIIAFRHVSTLAEDFLVAGYPTKFYCIKNKTARLSICAGLLAIDPKFSRAASEDEYKEYSASLAKSFSKDPGLEEIQLILTEERINKLKTFFGNNITVNKQDSVIKISWEKIVDGIPKKISVTATPIRNTSDYLISDDETSQPVYVIGKKGKPITADYDLFFIARHFMDVDFRSKQQSPIRTQSGNLAIPNNEYKSRLPQSPRSPTSEDILKQLGERKEDENAGNWSEDIKDVVQALNEAIADKDELRRAPELVTIHHNAELNNPYAGEIEESLPCLVVFPHEMDLTEMSKFYSGQSAELKQVKFMLLELAEELTYLRDAVRNITDDEGYYIPTHKKHTRVLPPFNREAVRAAQKAAANRVFVFQESRRRASIVSFLSSETGPEEAAKVAEVQLSSPRNRRGSV